MSPKPFIEPKKGLFFTGDEARLYRSPDGREVIRVSHQGERAQNPAESLSRYYCHKIARLLIPKEEGEVLDITGASVKGILRSGRVKRSKPYRDFLRWWNKDSRDSNILDNNPKAKKHWDRTNNIKCIDAILNRGLNISLHTVNVDILPDGRPFFFEVLDVNPNKVRKAAEELPAGKRSRVLGYLSRLEAHWARNPESRHEI